jgi:hypothetical protein
MGVVMLVRASKTNPLYPAQSVTPKAPGVPSPRDGEARIKQMREKRVEERRLLAEATGANPLDNSAVGCSRFAVFVDHVLPSQVAASGSCDVEVPCFLVDGGMREDGVETTGEVMVIGRREVGRTSQKFVDDVGVEEL